MHVRNPACSPRGQYAEWNLLVSVSIVGAVIIINSSSSSSCVVVVVIVLVLVVIIMY